MFYCLHVTRMTEVRIPKHITYLARCPVPPILDPWEDAKGSGINNETPNPSFIFQFLGFKYYPT